MILPLILRSRAKHGVSKDGGTLSVCGHASRLAEFIIGPRFARTRWLAPQHEVGAEDRHSFPISGDALQVEQKLPMRFL
jgi:hypothetical protein